MRLLVTSYKNPDLDGAACAFGYAELLQKEGKIAIAAVSGNIHTEAQFVLTKFSIPDFEDAENIITHVDGLIIVDASDRGGLSDKIQPEKVIEIIDHRKINEAHTFPNAKVQIEPVGSAATLIAEKFCNHNVKISKESAALLYSAIISNTINFQANVTTARDRTMADWLKVKFLIPKHYIREMFTDKSQFRKSLKETIIDDFAIFTFSSYSVGITQLELVNVDKFIQENLAKIKFSLEALKKEKSIDRIFLTCIDVDDAYNNIVVIDAETQQLLEQALNVTFVNGVAKRQGILMRKEIVPLVKGVLEMEKAS